MAASHHAVFSLIRATSRGENFSAVLDRLALCEGTIDHCGRSLELMRRRIESLGAWLAQATLRGTAWNGKPGAAR